MEDVLDLYEKGYNMDEPVLCLDEKPVHLLQDPSPLIPMKKGKVQRRESKYIRKGTANTYCIVEPKAGRHFTYVTENKKSEAFAKVMYRISRCYPNAKTIHLVMDNYSTHTLNALIKKYNIKKGKEIWNRFTIHYTPKNASWLDQAEIEIGIYTKQCLGKNRISSIEELRERTNLWNKEVNKKKLKIQWKFTTKEARKKFKYEK